MKEFKVGDKVWYAPKISRSYWLIFISNPPELIGISSIYVDDENLYAADGEDYIYAHDRLFNKKEDAIKLLRAEIDDLYADLRMELLESYKKALDVVNEE